MFFCEHRALFFSVLRDARKFFSARITFFLNSATTVTMLLRAKAKARMKRAL
jgi:hypothetical protein